MKKVIAVDWDGTLVEYKSYDGPGNFGAPVPSMVERVKQWLADGHEVIIHTARVSLEWNEGTALLEAAYIRKHLANMGLPHTLIITANKFSRVTEFWDDRAVRIARNKGEIANGLDVL